MPINEYSLQNLANNQLFFNFPEQFNDPFDGHTPTILKETSKTEWDEDRKVFFEANNVNCDEMDSDEYILLNATLVKESINNFKKRNIQSIGASCFSLNNDNILMWSHYAASHTGICLSFDTSCPYFNKLKNVEYKNKIPKFDGMKFLKSKLSVDEIGELFCTKFIDWEYEQEYRLVMEKGGQAYPYPANCLKAIYLGLKTDPKFTKVLNSICPSVPIFKAKKSATEFKVIFDSVDAN